MVVPGESNSSRRMTEVSLGRVGSSTKLEVLTGEGCEQSSARGKGARKWMQSPSNRSVLDSNEFGFESFEGVGLWGLYFGANRFGYFVRLLGDSI